MSVQLFREGSGLLQEIHEKFDSGDIDFPLEDLKGFLNAIGDSIDHLRTKIFLETDKDVVYVFYDDLKFPTMPNLKQQHFLLYVLIECVIDIGNELYEIIEEAYPNDKFSYPYVRSIFEILEREKNHLTEQKAKNELVGQFKRDYDFDYLTKQLDDINEFSLDQKISMVNEFIIDLESSFEAAKHLGEDLEKAKMLLSDLYLTLSHQSNEKIQEIDGKLESLGQEPKDLSVAAKVIVLHQLGILEDLKSHHKLHSVNSLSEFLSKLIGGTRGNIQPYLNPLKNGDFDHEKSPYSTSKAVSDAKFILEKYHIKYKENQ